MDFSNASIIKNQESDNINIYSEQQKYIDNILLETYNNNDSNKNIIEEKNNILTIINKYKFWIISLFIIILLFFMAYKNYSIDKIDGGGILSGETIDLFKLNKNIDDTSVTSFTLNFQ